MMKRFFFLLSFLALTGTAVMAQEQERPGPKPAAETGEKFRVGLAGYSFVKLNDLDKSLSIMQRADVHYLCIKDFHLPFKSTQAEIAAFHAKLKEKGVTGYAVGPIYMKTEAEIDSAFAYACNSHGRITVALDVSINFTRPAGIGDLLTVEATEVYLGNKTGVYDIRTTNEKGELVALFKGTAYRTSRVVS